MAILTGQTVASTYSLLLKAKTSVIDGTVATVQDGLANDSALMISTGAVKVMRGDSSAATLEVTGTSTLTGAVTATAGVTGALDGIVGGTTPAAVTGTTIDGVIGSVTPAAITGTVITGSTSIDGVVGSVTPAAITGTLITADTNFAGNITGDVTGNTTGTVTAASVLADGVTATTQPSGTANTTVATTAFATALAHVPAGAITAYGGSSAPTGWLLCNGAEKDSISDTTLAALYVVIGNTYGGSDGSDFLLPDLQGNVAVGKDSSTFGSLGDTGGVEEHALTISEMPAHGHDLYSREASGSDYALALHSGREGSIDATATAANVMESVGGSVAHTNLQPYIVLNYIIKT